ncbi:MAG: Tetratricopeptide TPR_1 repeat-containing protein [candidate division TM6 bacterium GW2011_GWF2_28_16]|nr:MAG: Tetratricopeptide TPR_1 repeat-containing protein [candidate division TM6 bacterium GW2011_GWF2_28_16]
MKCKFFLKKILLINIFLINFIYSEQVLLEQINSDNNSGIEIASVKKNWGQSAKNYHLYLSGSYDMAANPDKAVIKFEKLKRTESSVYFYDNYIRFLFLTNQFEAIVNLDQKIKDAFKGNLEIEKIFAQAYFYVGRGDNSQDFLNRLIEQHPNDVQLTYFKAVSLIKSGKLEDGIKFVNACLENKNLESKYFLFYFLMSKIYLQKNQPDQALKYVNKSLDLFQDFEKGWLLKSIIQEQQGQITQAIAGYKKFLDIVGTDEPVEKQLVRLLFVEKRFDEASVVLEKIKNRTPAQDFDLALVKWHSGNVQQALVLIDDLIKKYPDFSDAKLLKVEILVSLSKKEEVLNLLKDWLLAQPENKQILQVLLLLRLSGFDKKNIIDILELVDKEHSNELIISALIDLNFEKDDTAKVLVYCKKLFDLTKDSALKSKILFQTAYTHFAAGNTSNKVENILRTALKYEPVYPSVYNLFAYYYAQIDKNLGEALTFADKALTYLPNSYYYIDTKAYVLFKMGKIEESIKLFETALSINPKDEEVLKHLNLAKSFGQ